MSLDLSRPSVIRPPRRTAAAGARFVPAFRRIPFRTKLRLVVAGTSVLTILPACLGMIVWDYVASHATLTWSLPAAGIGLVVMIASALVGLLVSERAMRSAWEPVLALAGAARRAAQEHDYSARIEKRADDELETLTDDVNGMFEQLQSRDESLRRIQEEQERQLTLLQEQIEQRERVEEALRKSEEQLRQSQKMEAIGLLAGGIAHDFNNLLTVINGHSQMLIANLPPDDLRRIQLSTIKEAGDRAAALTKQLLAFSRKQIMAPRQIELDGVVIGMSKILRRLVGEHIEVVVLPGAAGRRIVADPAQIEQVVLNLVVNARDAMPSGGTLTLATERVDLEGPAPEVAEAIPPGRYVRLTVADNGAGMDSATRARIFEPFFTTKGVGKGTGLGLSTVYGVVRQSGGHITVDSTPGMGTAFRIYFPALTEETNVAGPRGAAPAGGAGSETILLVEDEAMVRQFTRMTLERAGYTVLEASYGPEAIQICARRSGPIHLLLTDVIMPQMNGREVVRRVGDFRPGIRVLYMSGYVDAELMQDGLFDPETNFIQKPFATEKLLQMVRRVLDRRQAGAASPSRAA